MSIKVETEKSLVLREIGDCKTSAKSWNSGQIVTKINKNISFSTPVATFIFYIHNESSTA